MSFQVQPGLISCSKMSGAKDRGHTFKRDDLRPGAIDRFPRWLEFFVPEGYQYQTNRIVEHYNPTGRPSDRKRKSRSQLATGERSIGSLLEEPERRIQAQSKDW